MKARTEWIVAALLMGACGSGERVEGRAAAIAPEKALIASAKHAEEEARVERELAARPGARAPVEAESERPRGVLRAIPHWRDEAVHREGEW